MNSSFNLGEPIPQPKIVKKIQRSLPERFRPKVVAIEECQDLNSLTVEELVGNLQSYEANHCQIKKGKDIALMSSNSVECNENSDSSCDSEDARFEAYFSKKFKKMWKNKKSLANKDSQYPKAHSKGKSLPKTERNQSTGTPKPVKCFECQGYGHTAAQYANRRDKSKGKILNVAWDEDSNEDVSEPYSPSNESGKFIAFMGISNTSSMQGSKSDEDLEINEFSDEEHDANEDYKKRFLNLLECQK